jgi:hypothetical protein
MLPCRVRFEDGVPPTVFDRPTFGPPAAVVFFVPLPAGVIVLVLSDLAFEPRSERVALRVPWFGTPTLSTLHLLLPRLLTATKPPPPPCNSSSESEESSRERP